MMSAADLRIRATDWAARAERAIDGKFKLRLERIARNWASLAATADVDEAYERRRRGR
jgi:hypothetical protein